MRERTRALEKPNRKKTNATAYRPVVAFTVSNGISAMKTVDRRREDPARSRKKRKISLPHIGEASLPQIRTQTSVREKIKNNKNNLRPYLFARAFATGFLSAETDRADCVVAENIMRADL
jgi:hypothetical protein